MKSVKIAIVCLSLTLGVSAVMAQPTKSRVQQNRTTATAKSGTTSKGTTANTTSRAALMFPTAVDVPEDVSWRRDIYRSLDLTKDENAALYYPIEPQGNQVNLFTLLFQLLNTGKIPAYSYTMNGREDFTAANRMHFKDMLDRYSIFYEVDGNSIKVDPSDVPSAEVLSFNVKESSYYDQNTATYHSRVVAICPVLHRSDDFMFGSENATKYPLFWVKMDDIESYLSQHMVMTSNINNAAMMSMADFFATNKYKGTIYMTTNMQGKTLAETAPSDSAMVKEQKRIEKEMTDFEKHIWSTPIDSAEIAKRDSIAAAESAKSKSKRVAAKTTEKASRTSSRSSATKKEKSSSKSSGSATPRVSVRRERH